jgi:hypothetical protein
MNQRLHIVHGSCGSDTLCTKIIGRNFGDDGIDDGTVGDKVDVILDQ